MKNLFKLGKEVYITSQEFNTEGWYFNTALDVNKPVLIKKESIKNLKQIYGDTPSYLKKINLTTDAKLLVSNNHPVQEIDDEGFLEWLSKNPKCTFVETKLETADYFGKEIGKEFVIIYDNNK